MEYSVYKLYSVWLKNLYLSIIKSNNNETHLFVRVILSLCLLFVVIIRSPKIIYTLWKERKRINRIIQLKKNARIRELLLDVKKLFPNLDEKTSESLSSLISYSLMSFALKDLFPKFQQVSEKLLEKGWFFNDYIRIDIVGAPPEKIFSNEYNVEILRNNIDEIEQLVISRFPERAIFIKRAFEHHKSGDYISSIPIMIIQIDGIFRGLTEKELFSTSKKRRAASWLSETETTGRKGLTHFVLEPLKNEEYFGSNFEKALKFPEMVSRNRIIHGEDLHYHSALNSYKVISLLLYISSFVYDSISRASTAPSLAELYKAINKMKNEI